MSTSSADKKADIVGVDAQPAKGGKLLRSCKRFWWVWLAGFLLFVLIFMIILVYAIIPAVAQKKIDSTVFHLNSMKILDPTPSSFVVSVNGTITGATGTAKHARLEAMKVKLYLEDVHDPIQPIMELPMAEIHGGENVPIIQNDVKISITNQAALEEFSDTLMSNSSIKVGMKGRTKMWLGKINSKINYNEVLTMNGFNHLSGMVITNYSLDIKDTTYNVRGDVLIPNPTVVTLQMGDVSLLISLSGTKIGTGVIPDLLLTPGNHTYPFKALFDQSQLLPMAVATGKGTPLEIGSEGASIKGVKIAWLSKPLITLMTLVPVNPKYIAENPGLVS